MGLKQELAQKHDSEEYCDVESFNMNELLIQSIQISEIWSAYYTSWHICINFPKQFSARGKGKWVMIKNKLSFRQSDYV